MSILFLLTRRTSRPLLIIAFPVLALFSLTLFTAQEHNPVNTITKFISIHKAYQDLLPTMLAGDEEQVEITADIAATSPSQQLANATLLMLARNSDIDSAVNSVREVEDKFNRKYGYPWVFLNEEPFSYDFKRRVSNLALGPVHFGQIPKEHWYQPDWINETFAAEERDKMVAENVIYGGSVSYRNMCRFNSGFFYRHPLMQQFRYYWRVEPGVHFYCDVNIDPFVYMQENNKTYGFTITLYEFSRTIESLWHSVQDFITDHPEYVAENNAMNFISDDRGNNYNLCHFWSNFEIADLDFWRGEAYSAFFEYLDNLGGFYYERWGDAPVHSIAAALFAGTDRIHFFREIGYDHYPYMHCPAEPSIWEEGRCACDPNRSFDYNSYSCLRKWDQLLRVDPTGR